MGWKLNWTGLVGGSGRDERGGMRFDGSAMAYGVDYNTYRNMDMDMDVNADEGRLSI